MAVLLLKVEAALGADLTAPPSGWAWTDITAYVRRREDITVKRGGSDEFSTFQPSRITFVLNNSDGRFTTNNPTGAYYGTWGLDTPVRVSINATGSYNVRSTCFVSQITHVWPIVKEAVAEVVIVADGSLRRAAQGKPLRSYLYRTQHSSVANRPIEYWSMEGGAETQLFASALPGGQTFGPAGPGVVTFGGFSDFPGSEPLPVFGITSYFTCSVRPYTSPATNTWVWQWVMYLPTVAGGTVGFMDIRSLGTVQRWRFTINAAAPDTIILTGYNSANTEVLGSTALDFTDSTGAEAYARPLAFELRATQNGANIDWIYNIFVGPGQDDMGGKSGSVAGTLGNTTGFSFGGGALLLDATVGHLTAAASTSYGGFFISGATGAAGDTAWGRWLDLFGDAPAGVQGTIIGTPTIDTIMGVEQSADFVTLLRQVIEADQGIGYELKDSRLIYVNRSDLYNKTVDLTLVYDGSQIAVPWIPQEDDLLVRNDWEVGRFGGGTSRYQASAVNPDSPSYDPTVAVHGDQITVNLDQDSDLPYHAQWRVHLGQDNTLRYPTVSIDLDRATSLQAAWQAAGIGSRIQITNPPPQLAPDTIDLLVVGYTETFHRHGFGWRVDLNCVSYLPFEVFEIEEATHLGRLESDGSTLNGGVSSSATSLSVATASGPLWTTSSGDRPFDIEISGERMTVTNLTGSTSPQTFVVTRSVNGVVKAQSSGAAVTLWRGGVLAL